MGKIEIYEDNVRISQLDYLRPIIIVLSIIMLIVSLYIGSIVYEQHSLEPTKESCIEYFTKYSK